MSANGAAGVNTGLMIRKDFLQLFFQLFHLALAAAILLTGFAEFSVEPTIFDVFGTRRSAIPNDVFKVNFTSLFYLC